ncbi:MAG: VanZ family protein [Chitinophagaceae bacterium]|jgi:VanZ family protein|nr:VanZ family protein [Chitinophagaceae bacterium]
MIKQLQAYFATKWPVIIWSVIIFLLLVMPPISIAKEKQFEITQLDKIIHALLFGIQVVLWGYCLQSKNRPVSVFRIALAGAVLISCGYGILMEYVQLWVDRDFDVWDMLADAIGACLGWLYFLLKKRDPGGNRGRNQN